jgi:hypothetical protein
MSIPKGSWYSIFEVFFQKLASWYSFCGMTDEDRITELREQDKIRAFLDDTAELDVTLKTMEQRKIEREDTRQTRDPAKIVLSWLLWKIATEFSVREFTLYALSNMKKLRHSIPDVHERYAKIVKEAGDIFDPEMTEDPLTKRTIMKLVLELNL